MATVVITGGTGLIGKALTNALLKKNYEVIALTRKIPGGKNAITTPGVSYAHWNIKEKIIDADTISKADYIVHLAGANLSEKRWTNKRKQEIISSRVDSGKLIAESLASISNNVKAIISSSGIGYYGADNEKTFSSGGFAETDLPADDFLGQTGKLWEESIQAVMNLGKRLVIFRAGPVLSNAGGYLAEFKKYLRFGLATIIGNGKQIVSWIHLDDIVRMYIEAIENKKISGVYNAVAPNPVSNKEFVLKLGKIQRRNFFVPVYVPSFVLKIVLGEMSIEALKSSRVSCSKIIHAEFEFKFPTLTSALKDLK